MTTDRPDQPIIISDQPTATEAALLLQLRNRQRLRDRERGDQIIAEAIRRAGGGLGRGGGGVVGGGWE
jgi:hypothetical protein